MTAISIVAMVIAIAGLSLSGFVLWEIWRERRAECPHCHGAGCSECDEFIRGSL